MQESSLEAYRQDAVRQATAYQNVVVSQVAIIKSLNRTVMNTEDHTSLDADEMLVSDLIVDGSCSKTDSVPDAVVNLVDNEAVVHDDSVRKNTSELGSVQPTHKESPVQNGGSDQVMTREITENIAVDVIKAKDVPDRISFGVDTNLPADIEPLNANTVCKDTTSHGGLQQKSIAELEDELDSLLAM